MSDSRLMLFDTASMYYRAFYGVPTTLRAPDGRPVNAVRGLLDFAAIFLTEYSPTHLACCWDVAWRPAWRVALLPSYKAHRVGHDDFEEAPAELAAQVPLIVEVLTSLGVPMVGADDHEADDVIGTLAASSGACDVVTGDRDLFQVVDDSRKVRVLYLGRGVSAHEQVDGSWIAARYGVSASQYADFALLRGDPSDGLAGVPGIGEKTAAGLLATYHDLGGILSAAQAGALKPRVGASLLASTDYLTAAAQVVRVATNLELGLPDLRIWSTPAQPERFAGLADELGLGRSAERVLQALAAVGQPRNT